MEVEAISTALEREAFNWVRLAALVMIIAKQLKRCRGAGGRDEEEFQVRDHALVITVPEWTCPLSAFC